MKQKRVLLIDDRLGDITWLVDLIENRGYLVETASNEVDARLKLETVKRREASYVLAIVDIMVSVKDIRDLVQLDEGFYAESLMTGVRLCRYTRDELDISKDELPIVCISARFEDEEVRKELEKLEIPLFSRVPQSSKDNLRAHLGSYLE